ncbi:3-oxoacid CoA-transferase subunit B [Blastococcus sp. BMG 814]|uniref:3-oxoacid CoA-transferase subunit B n=2 Tax=Blastococcus carthaginiensis TaxID=3050034 RepID=A0ABT9IE98_9ACTN|nr:3-oxoacid CoA-transferase subunit B [Blastococcus carthaginiensis]MDP5183914.1 3-oxoacid CoA-transferase subunit B [Blastococcus carthaginiensis]
MTAHHTLEHRDQPALDRSQMAERLARDIAVGSYVNLGVGLPTLVAEFIDPEHGVTLHTENGMLGMGPVATGDEVDPDLVNAGKLHVTELPGAAYFDHPTSFAMMRGGHLDLCVLGAYQVSARGDLANWHTGEPDAIPGVGGAMDLAVGAKSVFAIMTLFDRDGMPKIVPECTYPLTGAECVSRVYTDLAVFRIDQGVVTVVETYGTDVGDLSSRLGMPLRRLEDVPAAA